MRPDIESIAASIASTPASTAAMTEDAETPEVSWVWKCIGRPVSWRSVETSFFAAAGLRRPAMSLMPMMWAPAASSSLVRPT